MDDENPTSGQASQENLSRIASFQPKEPLKPQTFQLCFVVKEQIGRSNIKIGKPLTVGKV